MKTIICPKCGTLNNSNKKLFCCRECQTISIAQNQKRATVRYYIHKHHYTGWEFIDTTSTQYVTQWLRDGNTIHIGERIINNINEYRKVVPSCQ